MITDFKENDKISSTFEYVYCILLQKDHFSICFCFADGRLVSCFGKSKLEVGSVTLKSCEISAQARNCTILKMISLLIDQLIRPPENCNLGTRSFPL